MSDTAIDLVDSHCHLDRLNLDAYEGDFQAMMAATRADGISHMLCIGVDLETFPRVRELAERYATPLPQLTRRVEDLSARVDEHLKKMGVSWV